MQWSHAACTLCLPILGQTPLHLATNIGLQDGYRDTYRAHSAVFSRRDNAGWSLLLRIVDSSASKFEDKSFDVMSRKKSEVIVVLWHCFGAFVARARASGWSVSNSELETSAYYADASTTINIRIR